MAKRSKNLWKRYILIEGVCGCLLLFSVSVYAAPPIKTICGDYTYVVSENVSRDEAKHIAAERARIEALSAVYGINVSQINTMYISDRNGESDAFFQSLGNTAVRGEWLGDTEEPTFRFYMDEYTGETRIHAHVCGRAREIKNSRIALDIHTLRNGVDANKESSDFRAGDDLYCSFAAPLEGYLAIFLLDAEQNVVCMLPYQAQNSGSYKILKDKQYLFFYNDPKGEDRNIVDEYVMTCSSEYEANYLYFVFSTEPFSKPATPNGSISFEAFNQWQSKLRHNDTNMQVIQKMITIRR